VTSVLLTWDRAVSRQPGRLLARLGVRPAAVTVVGLVLSVLTPLVVRQGPVAILLGAGLVGLATVAYATAGTVATVTQRATRLGYVYGALAERLTELAWLTALWLLGAPLLVVVPAAAVTFQQEYARARATAAGGREIGAVTLAERPTRAAVAGCGLALTGLAGLVSRELVAGTATLAVAAWLLFGLVGLGQLLAAVPTVLRHRAD
jgi:CDP-diacylglycerol--glycerol-3-phosphate 3-phosphatidyltransferase